jgi:hypothetical protein
MDIRFARIEDIPGILSLLRQVGQVHHEGRPDIFRAGAQKYGASQVIALLDKPGTAIFVAAEKKMSSATVSVLRKKQKKTRCFVTAPSCTSMICAWTKTAGVSVSAKSFTKLPAAMQNSVAATASH